MKTKFLMPLFLFVFISIISFSQNDESWKVYDDSEVAEIRITMNPDDLQYLYDYPEKENDSMMVSRINFKNALIDETIDSVGVRIRGNTSRESAKKSFKLSFNTFIKGRKFYSLEKMNLNGEHNDPSIIRSKLCWEFFNDIGIASSRASHAAVYINGDYYGLYISVEHIDENFIKKNYKDDSGNLWKCLYGADLTPLNNNNISAYTLETNTGANDFSELDSLTKIINNTTLTNFENSIDKYFNVVEYLKVQAVDIITGSWDDYSVLSNNFYLYHDPSTDIFHWVPYDYDNTFGIDWLGVDWANANPYTFGKLLNQPRPLINRLMEIPKYKNLLSHFIEFYLDTYMQAEKFNGHMDSIKTKIEPFALIDDYKSYDWGFSNEDFQNSYDAENFTIDPHVKYSIEEYNLLRKNSLNSQINYVDSEPIIYNISLSNTKPAYDESIKVNASIFSVNPIQLIYAELEYKDGSKSNVPLTYVPMNNTYKVELNDNWETEIPALGKNQNVNLKIYVEDNIGTSAFYPNDGINIKTAGELTKEVVLSELMSSNVSTIQDNAGEYDDWLEIYNPQDTTVNLSGKYLTDKKDNLTKWQFPANVKIEPKKQILIWCDEDQDQTGPHTNFKLSSKGEFVAIVNNDGITIVDSVTIPALNDNESFARENNVGDWFITSSSTPGASNIVTSISDQLIPKYSYKLEAFPNPFNPSTNIEYEIASPISVELKIYDILGREVWSSGKIKKEAGIHQLQWNGSDYASNELSSGIYLLNINSETYNKTIKLMLLR